MSLPSGVQDVARKEVKISGLVLGACKGPLEITHPKPLPRQGHMEQGGDQVGLERLHGGRLHNSMGSCPSCKELPPHAEVELVF